MEPIVLNGLFGAGAGACAAFIGFVGTSRTETFEIQKALPTILTGIVAGAMAGILSPDWKTAVNFALGGEVLRKATLSFIQQGAAPPVAPQKPNG